MQCVHTHMWSDSFNFLEGVKTKYMILTKLEREKQTSFGKTSSYNIISMIILNINYETIMSLCRKVQIVLQLNSQSRHNYKKYGKTL